jgi:hypothetical protein
MDIARMVGVSSLGRMPRLVIFYNLSSSIVYNNK